MSDEYPCAAAAGRLPAGEPPRITPREQEILSLIAEGLTDQEIAQRLWISRGTVRTHLVHLREKLQVHNRVALVRTAERLDLLPVDAPESTLVWIGEPQRPGYTDGQEVEPDRSPTLSPTEDTGGEASAGEPGDTEMLARNPSLWYLAALLAVGAQNGAARVDPAQSARRPRAPTPSVTVGTNGKAAGMALRRVWADPNAQPLGTVSADGRYLSYKDRATGNLAVRHLATGGTRRLTHDQNWSAGDSTVSRDGRQVAYAWFAAVHVDLRVIGIDGSRPRVLYRNAHVDYIQPYDWSPDDKQILALFRKDGTNQIVLVSAADGSVRLLKSLDWRYPQKMSFSPDGRSIAYDFQPSDRAPERDVTLLATDASREIPLVKHPADDYLLGWAPDGKSLLFASDRTGSVGAWALSVTDGTPDGAPRLVRPDMGRIIPLGLTRSGALYYMLPVGIRDGYTATLDRVTGNLLAAPTPVSQRLIGGNSFPAWSPDGKYVAYLSQRGPFPGSERHRLLAIRSVNGDEDRQLPFRLNYSHGPRWSPDGRSLLFGGSDHKNRLGLYQVDAQTGDVTALRYSSPADGSLRRPAWSPDGKAIFYAYKDSQRGLHLIVSRDLETGREKEIARGYPIDMALSPDGRQLALSLHDDATAEMILLIVPTTGGERRELLRVKAPERIAPIAWMPDGRHLLLGRQNRPTTQLWRIPAQGGKPRRVGLTVDHMEDGCLWVHPDGQRIAFTAGQPRGEIWVMENFLSSMQTSGAAAAEK